MPRFLVMACLKFRASGVTNCGSVALYRNFEIKRNNRGKIMSRYLNPFQKNIWTTQTFND